MDPFDISTSDVASSIVPPTTIQPASTPLSTPDLPPISELQPTVNPTSVTVTQAASTPVQVVSTPPQVVPTPTPVIPSSSLQTSASPSPSTETELPQGPDGFPGFLPQPQEPGDGVWDPYGNNDDPIDPYDPADDLDSPGGHWRDHYPTRPRPRPRPRPGKPAHGYPVYKPPKGYPVHAGKPTKKKAYPTKGNKKPSYGGGYQTNQVKGKKGKTQKRWWLW